MTDAASLQQSLAAMGFPQLALAIFALACYCLLLNASLGARVRLTSGGAAVLAALALATLTEPWTNGVILVAIGVAGVGVFVVAAWGISLACGLDAPRLRTRRVGAAAVGAARAGTAAPQPQPASAALPQQPDGVPLQGAMSTVRQPPHTSAHA